MAEIDLSQFTFIHTPMQSNWGYMGDKITVFERQSGQPFRSYYEGHHPEHPRFWQKLLAQDWEARRSAA